VKWELAFSKQAQKDPKQLKAAGLKDKALEWLEVLRSKPFQNPPPYEKLVGDLAGACLGCGRATSRSYCVIK
jgi:toxin YoeB